MALHNLTIGKRIALGFFSILLLAGIGSIVVLSGIGVMNDQLEEILSKHFKKIDQAHLLLDTGNKRSILLRNILLTDDEEEMATIKTQFAESVSQYTTALKGLQEMIESDSDNEEERRIIQAILKTSATNYPVVYAIIQNTLDGFGEESKGELGKVALYQKQLVDQLGALVELEKHNIEQANARFDQSLERSKWIVIIVSALVLILVIVIGMALSRSINRPARQIKTLMEQLVDSWDFNLRSNLDRSDEFGVIGRSIDQFLDQLQESLGAVSTTMNAVASGQLGARMEITLHGDLDVLKQDINRSAESVQHTIQALDSVMGKLAVGDFSQRINVEVEGDLDQLKTALNLSLDNLEEAIKEIAAIASSMSEGNFSSTVEGDYHGQLAVMKDAINATQSSLSNIVSEVRTSADHVEMKVDEIVLRNSDLSSRTTQQAASIEETATSMEEISNTVKNNTANIMQAKDQVKEALQETENGRNIVNSAVDAMDKINQSGEKISKIISLIDEISFQTNLLALNAAVEAARAGKYGRGFAVVAEEVRSLARRTTEATNDITQLIEESSSNIATGHQMVNFSGDALSVAYKAVENVDDTIVEIANAADEQQAGIEQVNIAISEIDSTNQQNAGMVEEVAAASGALKQQANDLVDMVAIFKVGQHGSSAQHNSPYSAVLSKARSAHLAWKGKIRGFLSGMIEMNSDEALSHHDCALGKWLDETGRAQFTHLAEMSELDDAHEQMHNLIRKIVELKHQGQVGEAEQAFGGIEPLSQQVVALLDQIEERSSTGNTPRSRSTTSSYRPAKTERLGDLLNQF